MNQLATHPTAAADRIPFGQKVAWGVGMLGNQMFPAALSVFMVVLVAGLGFPPLLWGILMFVPRILDAVTDPIMGFISDNTRSRWGRRRPYIFAGAIATGVCYIAMWQLYETNSLAFNYTYFLTLSLVFYVALTVFATPYNALGYEMSRDFHERTRLMAVAQFLGQWAWVIAPWFWPLIYNEDLFSSPAAGARTLSIWVGLGCMALALAPSIFVHSPSTKDAKNLEELSRENLKANQRALVDSFRAAFRCAPFRKLCAATFLVFGSFQTIAAFGFFIVVYYLFDGNADAAGTWPGWFASVGALCTTFLAIPTITWISQRLGKRNTFLLTQAVSIVGYALFWWAFRPGTPLLMLAPLPLFSFGIGGLFTLMMSMTADVCDLDELDTGKRREGIFAAIYWWMVKFGMAFAGLLSGLIMSLAGFVADAPSQAEGVMTGMRLAYSLVPIAGALLAIWVMRHYDLTEERANEIRAELEHRRGELALV